MPTSLAASRQTRDRVRGASAEIRSSSERATKLFVAAVAEAGSTAPIGTRPSWLQDLSTELKDGKSVTVERVLRLAIGSGMCGADLSTISESVSDLLNGECARSVEPLDVAICGEQDAESNANPLEIRAMKWVDRPSVATIGDMNELLKRLHEHESELDDLIRSVARHRMTTLRESTASVTASLSQRVTA